ncbi:pre-RNA processing PIH1/Nop17-domain-containing protein [Scleroderma citrinum]
MAAPKIPVALNPVPGFCVKTRSTNDTVVHATASDVSQATHQVTGTPNLIPVPQGLKVFVNIAWDANVPPTPQASEDAIQNAMKGLDIDESDPNGWFVPLVLSDARQERDKAGQPALVFDAIFNPSIKSRTLRDPDFKSFVIELACQRIEAQTTIVLSRQIGTPNIASKGKPQPRQILVPASLYPAGHPNYSAPTKLIQEIASRPASQLTPTSILKQPQPSTNAVSRVPSWSWKEEDSELLVVIHVPMLTHAVIPHSTLDIESQRILFCAPSLYSLDINLGASDAELTATFSQTDSAMQAVTLKRKRHLDVDNAKAEWRVADKTLILHA